MRFIEFLYDPGSSTILLKSLPFSYSLEVLIDPYLADLVKRNVVIALNQQPVILALSYTMPENQFFANLLLMAKNSPIGERLFAAGSEVMRSEVQVERCQVSTVEEKILATCLMRHGFKLGDEIYRRKSHFNYQHERMDLVEYILPVLENFLDRDSV